jgi:hypothetical protein
VSPLPPSGGLLTLPANVKLFLKHLPWINALPYFEPSSVDEATMAQVTFGVKLFMALINYAPKVERLSLSDTSTLA